MFLMDGGIEVLRLLADRIEADPIHSRTRDASPPHHAIALEQLDRASDRAATRQQRLTQLFDRLLRGVADEQIPKEASRHRRERVLAGVEAADVVGEDELRVLRHLPKIADLTEMPLICVISSATLHTRNSTPAPRIGEERGRRLPRGAVAPGL